jgi:hypothetical protein
MESARSLTQPQQWLRHHTQVREMKEGWQPLRFTDRQMEVYGEQGNYAIRSHCPAGICLDFMTDSSFIELDFSVGDTARPWLHFDLYVDGALAATLGSEDMEHEPGEVRFELESKERVMRRLTLYLPQTVVLTIRDVRIEEEASVEHAPKPQRGRLLALGDSITQGMDAHRPSSTYPVQLARALDMELLNQGVGGAIFDKRNLDPALAYRPDLITVAYGTNDWSRFLTLASFREACSDYIRVLSALYPDTPTYVITPIWRADQEEPRPMGTLQELSEAIREICAPYSQIQLIHGQPLVPHMPQMFGDGFLHPTDEGFLYMTLNLLRHIGR